jgi:hypothetical protein
MRASYEQRAATLSTNAQPSMSEDQRASMRRLAVQLRELLNMLDTGDAAQKPQGK